ncbi:MAG TPA: PPC domain-containing protein, partial [Kofleriaceae bacterium]|nr:PPC domain-containing protein [Kofleriaceae bacterium]
VQKRFFQSGGSITLTEDPFTNQHMIASISNLQLEEVTIDSQSFTSTPVAGGACMSFADFTEDHDKVPNAWTCTHSDYAAGTMCNCMCGLQDPDCTDTASVAGCTVVTDRCFNGTCVTPPTNDTCQTATPITLPLATPLTGSTAGAKHNYNLGLEPAACTGFAQPGPDVAYAVALTASQQITVTLSNLATTFDGSIALVGPQGGTVGDVCDASPITTCVKGADAGVAGGNETFQYTTSATGAGTYYIIVDSYDANVAGTFTLNVTSP